VLPDGRRRHPGDRAAALLGTGRWAGAVTFSGPGGGRWRVFACDAHHDGLDDTHPLTDDDQVYLAGLDRQWERALAGKPWARPLPVRLGDQRAAQR